MATTLLYHWVTLCTSTEADYNQPSMVGATGGVTAGSSTGSTKLGKKGLAAGLRPDPGSPDGGEDGVGMGEACGEQLVASGVVGLFAEETDFFWLNLTPFCSFDCCSCAVVLGDRRGAGLGVSKVRPKGKG